MFRNLGLRWKILLALVVLSVLPLLVTLLIIAQLTEQQLEDDIRLRVSAVANFVERSTSYTQRERGSYTTMLAANQELVRALQAEDREQGLAAARELLQPLQTNYNFDLIEVLDPDGTLRLRLLQEGNIPPTSGKDHPVIEASLEGDPYYEIDQFDGQLSIVAAAPIKNDGAILGHLVVVTFLDGHFAERIKSLSGAEMAFFDNGKVYAATNEALKTVDMSIFTATRAELDALASGDVTSRQVRQVKLGEVPHAITTYSLGGAQKGVLLALDNSQIQSARDNVQNILGLLLAGAILIAVLLGVLISRGITNPLAAVVANLKQIADGEGDLTQSLQVNSNDEVGELAESFNKFTARLRDMVGRTRTVSLDMIDATEKIRLSSREVNEGAVAQSESLEESHRALIGIDESTGEIADSISNLVSAVEQSSAASIELGATIEQISAQGEKLFATVEEVTSSLSEMSVSSQQVAENVDILNSSTEVTASSIIELDASIKEIEENADQTSKLAEAAARDAEQGKKTVDATIAGIGDIRETVDQAGKAIQELGNQSSAIGKILTVIDDVADQTSLLALNAAIIAAQAGEHGKGFAVVADEIRELAERTAVSTREIGSIIGSLQNGTAQAVKAMEAGSARVHQEVARSEAAGQALEQIRTSTLKANEQVRSIVRATQEQSRGSRQITDSINQITSMLGQIASAIKQQNDGMLQLSRAAETMREIALQGKHGTSEQAKGSRQIATSMEQIREMIEVIDSATQGQMQRSKQVVSAVAQIREIAENNSLRTGELDQVVEDLSRQTQTLEDEVGAFKV